MIFFGLLWRAGLKYFTGATALNKGEQDQPPSDGKTFQSDHTEDAWAWGRDGKRMFKHVPDGPDEVETSQE